MITHQSPGRDCSFIFPILEDVDLLIDYNGLLWSVEVSKIDSLSEFSNACTGFAIKSFESNGNNFIVISKKKFTFEEYIELFFESRLQEDFPCAFYDESQKKYDDFSIPTDAQGFSLSVDTDDFMIITSLDYEEDEDYRDDDDIYIDEYSIPDPVATSITNAERPNTNDEILELQNQLNTISNENSILSKRISELETENSSLLSQLQSQSSITIHDVNDATKAELERLKTLVSQLADRDYNGDFIKTADAQINDLTRKIEEQKRLDKEKTSSLERLKKEYDDAEAKKKEIADEITHTMELLHKAESVQRESSTELSVFQKRLNDILSELQIDISTLEMYETQDGIDALLLEANDMKSRIETKLKALISSRQKDTTNRFNNITS